MQMEVVVEDVTGYSDLLSYDCVLDHQLLATR
jgi:hypothetical protein